MGLWVQSTWFLNTAYWHRVVGYFIVMMIAIRIVAGVVTRRQVARFYWPTLHHIKQHIHSICLGAAKPSFGHNPLGQLSVYCLWMLIVLLAVTGFLSRLDMFWGDDWLVAIHGVLSQILMLLVGIHLLAVIMMSYCTRENLLLNMWFKIK